MTFDQTTRNRLARFVSDARILLTEEFTRQLQNDYGLDPESGAVTGLEKLTALDDTRRESARILRETLDYYLAGKAADAKNQKDVLQRIVREQAFTILNRLCALRMAESRGILIESIAKGYQSKGFQLYDRLAGTGLGEKGDAYRSYLFSLFDEFTVDLAVLFDRFSPQGRLFPRQTALNKLLELINDPEIDKLWVEDETIGWMYQYFNTKEERQEMRAASSAPRNSRELAVRNQFFTPRYVVEFLTDNTLGRIWYEMTKGETSLKETSRYLVRRPTEIFLKEGEEASAQESADEDLSQEELLKQTVSIPHRPLKDPRELKMLDPACGSMHFGLYAFDLFEQIYAEAWNLEERLGKDALWRLADLDSLHETYPNREDFLRDVPRLIIERNIHGVDIDPRAVQIAGLSLWLRAQSNWQAQGVKPQERPQIRRSNIVCAESMPGDQMLLEEFLQTLKEDHLEVLMRRVLHVPAGEKVRVTKPMADALAHLVRIVWQEMELAGEAGSLLKIEETLREAIEQARNESEEKAPLFRVLEFGVDYSTQNQPITSTSREEGSFWNWAEVLVLAALLEYTQQSENGGSYRRRLFAEDAVQGFAFINLCQKQYDTVLMNPPFGESTGKVGPYLESFYARTKNNLYCSFVERCFDYCRVGFIGLISARTFVMYRDFEKYRREFLLGGNAIITSFADLGWEVLDGAQVETAAFVLERRTINLIQRNTSIGPFFRLLTYQPDSKGDALLKGCKHPMSEDDVYFVRRSQLQDLPGAPLAYWASQRLVELFSKSKTFEPTLAYCGRGAAAHVFFFRLAWEIQIDSSTGDRWRRLAHGGEYSPFFRENSVFIDWEENGKKVKQYILQKYPYLNGNYGWAIQDEDKYGRVGITSGKRNERFNAQLMPAGYIFTNEGQGFIPHAISDVWYSLGYLNSSLVSYFLSLTSGLQKTWIYIRPIPVVDVDFDTRRLVETIAKDSFELKRKWAFGAEESAFFLYPWLCEYALLGHLESSLKKIILKHATDCGELNNRRKELSDSIIDSTNLEHSDRVEIEEDFQRHPDDYAFPAWRNLRDTEKEMDALLRLVSYLVGCAFGRWDARMVQSLPNAPELPDAFDSPPTCPPGMLQNAQSMPAAREDVPIDYPLCISWTGIMVDEEGHEENIEERVREALKAIWGEHAEATEAEICQILGLHSLREYFQKPSLFFADHLKHYSKSRRQAPIYWPLSTPSNSYTLWLYYHRLSDQTLFTCVNDFVDPKLKQVSDEANRLRLKKGRSAADEKELERLTDFERELKDFRDELLRVARFWKPNLNDGVQITASPLWRLFQYKTWQKKLKETWESLEAGEYDWAHLAYSIRPEPVREKCKTDKSLAIAHDLEHLYMEPKTPLKKKAGRKKDSEMKEMFNED